MRTIWRDVRYAWRVLGAHPGVSAIAVVSLALGVGANSVMFSLVDGMYLRPLPVSAPASLVWIELRTADGRSSAMAWTDYLALKDGGGAFADVAVQNRRGGLLEAGGETELVLLTIVSDNYFPLLGVKAAHGRLFRADLDRALSNDPAAAISDSLWQRRFGADPGLIGRTIRLNNRAFTVVGILPPAFRGLNRAILNDVWVPISTWQAMGNRREFEERVTGQFEPLARLRPGSSLQAAQAQLDVFGRRLQQELPDASRGWRLVAQTQAEIERGGRGRQVSGLLLSITGLLVVIACANVAVLLLALAETRRREIAMRQALGASRGRLARQLLTESALLAFLGGVAALLVARWLIPVLPALLPPGPAYVRYDIRLDQRVVIATLATCLATILLFGLVPALWGSRVDLNTVIKTGGWETRRRHGGRSLLVVGQAMLGVTLLAGAGLLARSFLRTEAARPGFDTDRRTLLMLVGLSGPRDRLAATCDQITERAAALPGMKRVAYCRRFPMGPSGGGATRDVVIPGRQAPPDEQLLRIRYNQVSRDYLAVSGTRTVAGRTFTRADESGTRVALVSRAMAARFWPGGSPIGRWIKVDNADVQIVGVVEDTPIGNLHEPPEPFLYFPFAQLPVGEVTFLFETTGEPAALLGAVTREIRAVVPNAPLLITTTLSQHLRDALYGDWMPAVLSIAIAVAGMVLAAAGLFGVVMHTVTRRSRELGIRAVAGAQALDLVSMVLRQGLALAAAGAVLGVGLSLAAGRLLTGLLYGVSPYDPLALASAVGVVLLVGLLASLYPAWKATRVDPALILRAE